MSGIARPPMVAPAAQSSMGSTSLGLKFPKNAKIAQWARPDVSADAIVGFSHHSDVFNLNEREVNADLRSRCPVAWIEKYGGFWYVSSYDAVERVARDGDHFC